MKNQTSAALLRRALPVLCLLVTSLLLAACSSSTNQPAAATAVPQVSATVALAAATQTIEPTPTPQPAKAWLVTASADPRLAAVVRELAETAGWLYEVRPSLQVAELVPELRVVVLDAPPANLGELLAAAPQVQFVVIASVDLASAPNLSVVRLRPEYQAFVAGYIASLYAADWRSGGLLPADSPLGNGMYEAFVNGGRYLCGMCAPGWPLGVQYPQPGVLPGASDGAAWQGAAATLFDTQKVNLFFLSAESARPEVFSYLQGKDQYGVQVRLIGVVPPPPELQNQWLVTVRFDIAAALRQAWPEISAGLGGQVLEVPVTLEELSDELSLGVGRLRLVDELFKEIAAGRIYPLSVPPE
jgi:hypothetical protein